MSGHIYMVSMFADHVEFFLFICLHLPLQCKSDCKSGGLPPPV